jgi:hypothetical protein
MSLVALEAAVFDPLGAITLDALPDSELSASTRRVTRTATLDGNAAMVDNGWTASDSTLTIEAYLTPAEEATIQRLIRLYPGVICSTDQGCYLGAIQSFSRTSSGRFVVSFLIQRDMTVEQQPLDDDIPEPPGPVDPTYDTGWVIATNSVGGAGSVRRVWGGASSAATLPANVRPGYDYQRSIPMASNGLGSVVLTMHTITGETLNFGPYLSANLGVSFTGDTVGNWPNASLDSAPRRVYAAFALDYWLFGGVDTTGGDAYETESAYFSADLEDFGNLAPRDFPFDYQAGWLAITDLCEYDGALYGVGAKGPGNPFVYPLPIYRGTPGDDWLNFQWLPNAPQNYETGGTAQDASIATNGTTLIALRADGQYRYSTDGFNWSDLIDSGISACDQAAMSATHVVTLDTTGGAAVLWAAPVADLADGLSAWTEYTIPDTGYTGADRLWSLAYARGKFCVVGARGLVVEFATPGTWTVIDAGFDSSATLSGVAPIAQEV